MIKIQNLQCCVFLTLKLRIIFSFMSSMHIKAVVSISEQKTMRELITVDLQISKTTQPLGLLILAITNVLSLPIG